MLNLKSTATLKCAVVALLAFASCSKDETKGPETSDVYQVQAIYWNNSAQDSFVYVNNQLTEAWFKQEKESDYMQMSKYTYNADGFLAKSQTFSKYYSPEMVILSVDSLAWNGASLISYNTSYNAGILSGRDTLAVSLDATKRITQVGTKDTLRSEYSKQLSYVEFQFTGANITKRTDKFFYLSTAPDAIPQDIVETTTIEYGDLVNPLQEVLLKNPILAIDLEGADNVVLLSHNNPTKISYVGKDETEVATVTNEALAGTKVLSQSTYATADEQLTMRYSLKKIQ